MSSVPVDPQSENTSVWAGPKPRMVFFRLNDTDLPTFITGHFRDHVRCLRQFFEVFVISENADYDEVVDRLQPDIALFESGVYARAGRVITHTNSHAGIPKVGFLDADAYCLTRSVFLADMDDWGVETFFTIGVSAVGYTPDIADRTYAWPNFADKSIFHTYDGGHPQPILLSGSRENNYPWRVQIDRLLRERFSAAALPHSGWFNRADAAAMPTDAVYARSLGSALIVPTCGTIAEDLVRKHFEIPAAGALLLTERTFAVEAAGFVDMENCVFADPSDVSDKVEYLLHNLDVLNDISTAGQRLAHARHSIENRDQLRQWFELNRLKASHQHIVQSDLFGRLHLDSTAHEGSAVSVTTPPGVDRRLIADGHRLLSADQPGLAAERFAEVLNYHFEPEAAFGLGLCWLRLGKPSQTRKMLDYSTGVVLKPHGASHPDPVEWAGLVRVALCEGDLGRACVLAARYPLVSHPELERVRAVVHHLTRGDVRVTPQLHRHRSVHASVGDNTWYTWRADLIRDLSGCGREAIARRVALMPDPSSRSTITTKGTTTLVPKTVAVTFRALQASWSLRGFLARVRRRLRREWRKIGHRRQSSTPRLSIFQLLGGRELDVLVLFLVPDRVASRVESLVENDPSALALIRIGTTKAPDPSTDFVPRGLRSGVSSLLFQQVQQWGRTLVITSRLGASMLTLEYLANTDLLIVIDDGTAAALIERRVGNDAHWRQAPDQVRSRFAQALAEPRTRIWERITGHRPISAHQKVDAALGVDGQNGRNR